VGEAVPGEPGGKPNGRAGSGRAWSVPSGIVPSGIGQLAARLPLGLAGDRCGLLGDCGLQTDRSDFIRRPVGEAVLDEPGGKPKKPGA